MLNVNGNLILEPSKVVDENGEPLVVYHGTDVEFNEFDKTKGRANMDIQGMFFSPWELDAQGYGQNVKAFFLNIKNPATESDGIKALNKFKGQNNAGVKAREYLVDLGYDGVNNESEEFIAFNPNQIKSATNNNGEFSRNSNDIRYSITTGGTDIQNNIESLFVNFNDTKGKSKQEIFSTYDNTHKVIAKLPNSMVLPKELNVENKSVMIAEAYFLDHAHNHKHEKECTIEDYKRGFSLISPHNEMRVVPQKGSFSLAFIKHNPIEGWDCVVVAPKRGEFFVYKTMFGQKKKPYQNNKLIRHSASVRQGNAADLLIRGGLMSIHDFPETVGIKPNFGTDVNTPRYSITAILKA